MAKNAEPTVNTDHFVVTCKKSGKLVQSDSSDEPSLLDDLIQEGITDKLHILTRLDRPVSGIVLLSKDKKFNQQYLREQEAGNVTKEYLAIVEGQFLEDKCTLQHYHRQDSRNKKARIEEKKTKGYKSIYLECSCLKRLDNYSILKLVLKKGKFHQIRAQLSFIGYPIKGDVKYGARRKNPDRSIYLHAFKIKFNDLNNNPNCYVVNPDFDDSLWRLADLIEE